jgi:plastocyanin
MMCAAVTYRRSALVFALGLLVMACGSQEPGFEDPLAQADKRFVASVVDSLGDVGRSPSIAVDSDDVSRVAHLAFAEPVKEGQNPATRPIGSPAVPAVLAAGVASDAITRGAVAQDAKVTEASSTGIGVDGTGLQHVVWTERPAGVQYSTSEDGTTWTEPVRVTDGISSGVSIAVAENGSAWVAWIEQGTVRAASGTGGTFGAAEDVAEIGAATDLGSRTAIALLSDGTPVVAFNDPSTGRGMVATRSSGGEWSLSNVRPGEGGHGISVAIGPDDTQVVAYYTTPAPDRGQVRVATREGEGWTAVTVGEYDLTGLVKEGPLLSTGVAVDADGARYVAWYAGSGNGIRFATDAGGAGSFEVVNGTAGRNGASPSVALGPGGTVHVAWYDTAQKDLQTGVYGDVEVVLAHPVQTTSAPPPTTQPTGPAGECPEGGVELTASAGASVNGFDQTTLEAAAGPVSICFTNNDTAPHNAHAFEGGDASGTSLAASEIAPPAPNFQVLDLGELAGGAYFYQCDVHPTTMTGTLTVA